MQYGNQVEGDFTYKYSALLFKILPYAKRLKVRSQRHPILSIFN
jgi:hypothetical protein